MNRDGPLSSEARLAVVQFVGDDVRRACCDLAWMRGRWGRDAARAISRRLQQLEAMSTLADLTFLPFQSHRNDAGLIEVEATAELVLLIEEARSVAQGEPSMVTITVLDVRDRRARARAQ